MSDEFAARLRRLEDLQEIQQLFVDYGHHLDAGDLEAYAKLFADDGELLLGPVARASGREEIKAVMSKALAGAKGNSYHVISSPRVSLGDDRATSEVMWTVVERGADGKPHVGMIGHHVDDLVRERGRWRFRRRRGFVDIPSAMG
jgi:uncharacterized protein (TIGR02246 family)